MVRLLPLLFLFVLAAAAEASRSVRCPELQADNVCREASAGFAFTDGCNRVRCTQSGEGISTRRLCPPAETTEERSRCGQLAAEVFNRMGPLACANVKPDLVCASRGNGFQFSDGCNGVTCAGDGTVASTTMRACPDGNPEGAYCKFTVDRISDDEQKLDASGDGSSERRRRSEQEYACPQLSSGVVCKPSTNGFTYSDGCNTVTCHSDGTGQQSTFKYCPAPEPSDSAGEAYCRQAEREMQDKMRRASLRSRCLEPETVCQGPNVRQIVYNNGCNRCFCTGQGEDACTRRSCPKVLMTDEEFANYCKQRGAGMH